MTEGTGTPEITPYACLLYMHFPHVRAVLEHNGNRKADRQATVGGGGALQTHSPRLPGNEGTSLLAGRCPIAHEHAPPMSGTLGRCSRHLNRAASGVVWILAAKDRIPGVQCAVY